MRTTELLPETMPHDDTASSFEPAVASVLHSLRQSIAATLAGIGDFGKPADIFKTLDLDRTLARQLFRLASTAESIGNGGMIPSRTSMDRFLEAAKARGAGVKHIASVRTAYQAFERLIQTHAGDRATFNSMVSAASGIDEDWLATDLQHRRNAFRAMSHALGYQTKTRLATFILNVSQDGSMFDWAVVGGFVGMRVLRNLPSVHVFGTVGDSVQDTTKVRCGPLNLSAAGGGYLLEQFSSSPLPSLVMRSGAANNRLSREIVVENPVVGNAGSTTLMFGTVYGSMPLSASEPMRVHASVNEPSEKLLFDVLVAPSLRGDATPIGQATMGFQLGARSPFGPSPSKLLGNFNADLLGIGPQALATLEVPGYAEMLRAVDGKLNWDIDGFEAWRIRAEFPLFQSTLSIEWPRGTER